MSLFSPFPRDNETPTYFCGLCLMQPSRPILVSGSHFCATLEKDVSYPFVPYFIQWRRPILVLCCLNRAMLFSDACNGANPVLSLVVTPAPCSIGTRATPPYDAKCGGLSPRSFWSVASVPYSIRARPRRTQASVRQDRPRSRRGGAFEP